MKNKRFFAIIVAIIMSSLVASWFCYKCAFTQSQAIQLFKAYAVLVGSLCGVYQTAQSYTDKKKIENKNETM